ncbi:deoxyribonuclease IV [bacterium]|nr:deoxyribonuclease IV [bacterium]
MSDNKILVGSHISSAGGLHKAIERGTSIGATAIQLFTRSNRQWSNKPIAPDEAALFKATRKNSPIQEIVVHAPYLINLGSTKPYVAKKSLAELIVEINRCAQLGISYLVLHPGSHLDGPVDVCLEQIATHLDTALEQTDNSVMVVLETMAGQGSTVGNTFEQLAHIRSRCTHKRRIGYCIDTCHIFCAGYDISTPEGWDKTIQKIDATLGLAHVKAFHVNDSMTPCGSRKDRHAPLGEGTIPLATFERMIQDKQLAHIPKLLETPSDPEMHLWAKEIGMLKNFAK